MPNVFGWNYPAGAENDPRAPYNQPEDYMEYDPQSICRMRRLCKPHGIPVPYSASQEDLTRAIVAYCRAVDAN